MQKFWYNSDSSSLKILVSKHWFSVFENLANFRKILQVALAIVSQPFILKTSLTSANKDKTHRFQSWWVMEVDVCPDCPVVGELEGAEVVGEGGIAMM